MIMTQEPMVNLRSRIKRITDLFVQLENTSSRNEKFGKLYGARMEDEQLDQDITYCLEVLDGRHKIGYTFQEIGNTSPSEYEEKCLISTMPLKEFLSNLYTDNKSEQHLYEISHLYRETGLFVRALMNREWRLGIGKSQLAQTYLTPMLAKKFDPDKPQKGMFFVTEKLDGNRCIASFEDGEWKFTSRSGKPLKVSFDMSKFDPKFIYDGEILQERRPSQEAFNAMSGVVNSKYGDKSGLHYWIFDITNAAAPYDRRRVYLDDHCTQCESTNVHILRTLGVYLSWEALCLHIYEMLDHITSLGGEGVMINNGNAMYSHKRTDVLLKLKKVQTMDMRVIDLEPGTGKNFGKVGALVCEAFDEKENQYLCSVGTGLSDYQRELWACYPEKIKGKIVEVQYFSLSQSSITRGTFCWSLRHPRFKGVREDKDETSVY